MSLNNKRKLWILKVLALGVAILWVCFTCMYLLSHDIDFLISPTFGAICAVVAIVVGVADIQRNEADKPQSFRNYLKMLRGIIDEERNIYVPLHFALFTDHASKANHAKPAYFDSIEEVIENIKRKTGQCQFILIGGPGAGKTATLKHIALIASDAYLSGDAIDKGLPLPLLMNLGYPRNKVGYDNRSKQLPDSEEDIHPNSGLLNIKTLVQYWWSSRWKIEGNPCLDLDCELVCLLMDGLNEMPGDMKSALLSLNGFLEHYSGPVVITCRTSDYDNIQFDKLIVVDKLKSLPIVIILPMGNDEIFELLRQRLSPEECTEFRSILQTNREVKTLAENPHDLAIMIDLFEKSQSRNLPANRHILYDKYIEKLYEDKYKSSQRDDLEELKRAWGRLAYRMMLKRLGSGADKGWAKRQTIALDQRIRLIGGWRASAQHLQTGIDLGIIEEKDRIIQFRHMSLYSHFVLNEAHVYLEQSNNRQRIAFIEFLGRQGEDALPVLPRLTDIFIEECSNTDVTTYNVVSTTLVNISVDRRNEESRAFVRALLAHTSLKLIAELAHDLKGTSIPDLIEGFTSDFERAIALDPALQPVDDNHAHDFDVTLVRKFRDTVLLKHRLRTSNDKTDFDRLAAELHARLNISRLELALRWARALMHELDCNISLEYALDPRTAFKDESQSVANYEQELVKEGFYMNEYGVTFTPSTHGIERFLEQLHRSAEIQIVLAEIRERTRISIEKKHARALTAISEAQSCIRSELRDLAFRVSSSRDNIDDRTVLHHDH